MTVLAPGWEQAKKDRQATATRQVVTRVGDLRDALAVLAGEIAEAAPDVIEGLRAQTFIDDAWRALGYAHLALTDTPTDQR